MAKAFSKLYEGGGAQGALQLEANIAAIIAGGAEVITLGNRQTLKLWPIHKVASESSTLVITEFDENPPTAANQIGQTQVDIPAADGIAVALGLPKVAVTVSVTQGAFAMISLSAESTTGLKLVRYQ